jgi:hypothetical protein
MKPDDQERLSVLEEIVERLTAVVYLLNGRVLEIENKDSTAPLSTEGMTTIKGANYATGFSQIRSGKGLRRGRIKSRHKGGRGLIDSNARRSAIRAAQP